MNHVASVEAGYLGEVFSRRFPEQMPWYEDGAEPNADMWATAEETRDQITRELIDGAVGLRADHDNMAPGDQTWWQEHRDRFEYVAHRTLDSG